MLSEFTSKDETLTGYKLLQKLRLTGSNDRRSGSGILRSTRTADNTDLVNELAMAM